MGSEEMRFRVVGALGAEVMVAERELPMAHRIIHMLRCPVSEFPDVRPPDIQPDCFEQLILARQQIHMRESRKSFVAPDDLNTGVPLVHQGGAVPLTPFVRTTAPDDAAFAKPLLDRCGQGDGSDYHAGAMGGICGIGEGWGIRWRLVLRGTRE